MNLRRLPILLGALSASLAPLLVSEAASAQQFVYVQQPAYDGPRFRGGVGLEAGGLFISDIPNGGNLAAIGVEGQIGVQINHNWGVYATPAFAVLVEPGATDSDGLALGGTVSAGVLADYTFDRIPIGVAAGPTVGALFGGGDVGNFYGATFRAAWYPIMATNGFRRRALFVALDLSILGIGVDGVTQSGIVLVSPMVSAGFQAF